VLCIANVTAEAIFRVRYCSDCINQNDASRGLECGSDLTYSSVEFSLGRGWVAPPLKGVLNPIFRPFSFELNKKNRFFKMNFDLGFRVL